MPGWTPFRSMYERDDRDPRSSRKLPSAEVVDDRSSPARQILRVAVDLGLECTRQWGPRTSVAVTVEGARRPGRFALFEGKPARAMWMS